MENKSQKMFRIYNLTILYLDKTENDCLQYTDKWEISKRQVFGEMLYQLMEKRRLLDGWHNVTQKTLYQECLFMQDDVKNHAFSSSRKIINKI